MNTEVDLCLVNTSSISKKCTDEYVCWVDIMGTRNIMSESFQKSANFLLRFHSCVVKAIQDKDIQYYPMMDGVYIASTNWKNIKSILSNLYSNLSHIFIGETKNEHRFLVRGTIAYGQVFHGINITDDICEIVSKSDVYKRTLMFGMPIIQAISSEEYAPPFGIFIHESARRIDILQGRYFNWIGNTIQPLVLLDKINEYLDWCNENYLYLEMSRDKIDKYKELNKEHLTR